MVTTHWAMRNKMLGEVRDYMSRVKGINPESERQLRLLLAKVEHASDQIKESELWKDNLVTSYLYHFGFILELWTTYNEAEDKSLQGLEKQLQKSVDHPFPTIRRDIKESLSAMELHLADLVDEDGILLRPEDLLRLCNQFRLKLEDINYLLREFAKKRLS